MKLIRGTGQTLEVYDVGDRPLMVLRSVGRAAIKHNGWKIVGDDEARGIIRAELQRTGDVVKVPTK